MLTKYKNIYNKNISRLYKINNKSFVKGYIIDINVRILPLIFLQNIL